MMQREPCRLTQCPVAGEIRPSLASRRLAVTRMLALWIDWCLPRCGTAIAGDFRAKTWGLSTYKRGLRENPSQPEFPTGDHLASPAAVLSAFTHAAVIFTLTAFTVIFPPPMLPHVAMFTFSPPP